MNFRLINCLNKLCNVNSELSTGRMDPRVGSNQVGSDRVGSRFYRILTGRVGSGQHFGFQFFTDYFLVPESI